MISVATALLSQFIFASSTLQDSHAESQRQVGQIAACAGYAMHGAGEDGDDQALTMSAADKAIVAYELDHSSDDFESQSASQSHGPQFEAGYMVGLMVNLAYSSVSLEAYVSGGSVGFDTRRAELAQEWFERDHCARFLR